MNLIPRFIPAIRFTFPARFGEPWGLMVQLNILSGKKAGSQVTVRRFPFYVGRQAGNALQLDDPGVWDQHLTLTFKRREGYFVTKGEGALATVNNQAFETVRLFSGDVITLGSTKLQFWLAAVNQRGLHLQELFIWTMLIAVTAFQLFLIYQLAR